MNGPPPWRIKTPFVSTNHPKQCLHAESSQKEITIRPEEVVSELRRQKGVGPVAFPPTDAPSAGARAHHDAASPESP